MSNYITIKLRRGTAAQWTATNPVLAEGEFGAETDTRKFKIGNGSTAWNSLQYWGGSGGGAADFIDLGDVPASYSGQAGKFVKVNATADGLEFGTLTIAAGDLPSGIDAAKIANGSVSNTEFQYLDGVTAPIQTQFSNHVPYAGSSGNVNLGEFGIKAGQIDLDTSPTGTATVGTTRWNDTIGSIETTLKGGNVILKNGVDLVARIVNKVTPNTTLTKAAYQAVKVSGAQGQRLGIALAQANNDNNSADTLGLVIETIAANQEGFIMTVGTLEGINTTGSLQSETWADGDILYLSPTTAGRITNIKPTAPNHIIIIGYVEYAHANNGKIYVKIMNGWELGELHDVDTSESKTTPIDADALLLQDSADSSIWKKITWANLKATLLTYFNGEYVAKNTAITGATKTKITYDAKGLVTAGADATTADISDSTNRRYVTDAQQTVIGNTSGTNTGDQTITLTGDVTGTGTGSFAATIANNAVTLAKIQDITTARILGRVTAGSGDAEELTGTQATTLLDTFTSSLKGLAPASGGGTSNFLRADGTWAAPAGGGGGGADGTVLSPSQITAWQNNYNPSSWANTVGVLRINSNQFHFLSGLTATSDGHTVRIFNTGSYPIGLYNQNTDSTAANRFSFDDHDVIILPQNSVELYYDGTAARWSLAAGWTLNSESPFVSKYWNEAFTTAGDNHGATAALWGVSGGTATASTTGGITGARVGIVDLATGIGTTGRAAFYPSANNQMAYDDGTGKSYMEFKAEFRSPAALSDATNEYFIHAGFKDSVTGDPSDGAYLKYTHGLNSGQWQFLTADNTVRTTGNSTVAMAINTWYCMRVVMYPNGTAEYYIDGVSLGRNTANMPSNGRDFSFGIGIRKNAGTTARNMLIDGAGYTVVKYRK
jgi:nitrogen fixation protein